MLCKTYCSSCWGVDAITVTIEVDVSQGISFFLVGLPDSAVRESQQRISTALHTIGGRLPGKKIVINMAPADLKKEGSSFDLAIAIGILAASGQYNFPDLKSYIILGELALDGTIRPVPGALPIALHAKGEGFKYCIFPMESAFEAAEIDGIDIYGVADLREVISILLGEGRVNPIKPNENFDNSEQDLLVKVPDFADIKGQESAKRGLEIAAAGGHNIIMIGPPGSGKSYMAKALAGILPTMNRSESLETSKIYSVAGKGGSFKRLIRERPFRSPHHSSSLYAITGGGTFATPGEISLAHNGVLYLDEIPEFSRSVLEVLRQPLEDREISISRLKYKFTYPCNFMLVASMNPCPCGYYGQPDNRCSCSPYMVNRYLSKISGPLLDRIDMQIQVNPVPGERLISEEKGECSSAIRSRVAAARTIQQRRFGGVFNINAQIGSRELKEFCRIGTKEQKLLSNVISKLNLSARGYSRILKVARTIADLDSADFISLSHLSEAIQYRGLDRRLTYE